MKRALSIRGKGRHRSPTAEQIFSSRKDRETDSAGPGADADGFVCAGQIARCGQYRRDGEAANGAAERLACHYPKAVDGLRSMAAAESAKEQGEWVDLRPMSLR
jgi:hypothetical protein